MRGRAITRLATLAASAALALGAAVPATGVADTGGVPHTTQACPGKGHGHGPKHAAPNSHGRKCGFNRQTSSPPPVTGDDDGSDDVGDDGGTEAG
jgi:hypothetical protein